eukprot:1198786-Lingulodinium_polyedra.AAC.1
MAECVGLSLVVAKVLRATEPTGGRHCVLPCGAKRGWSPLRDHREDPSVLDASARRAARARARARAAGGAVTCVPGPADRPGQK